MRKNPRQNSDEPCDLFEMIDRTPQVYTVSQLTEELRLLLEEGYAHVIVEGEISGWKVSSAGHAYFRLKDENAVLESVIWKSDMRRLGRLSLGDGQAVRCTGRLTIYPPRGQYQLVVEEIQLAGLGLLQRRFEELKQRLQKEGLFDEARKKPLPAFPKRIGIATSSTGAAIQDFLKIAREHRLPLEIVIASCRVQGVEAPSEIAQALQSLDRLGLDWLITMRGGGSLEDLWAFNEEIVARAIASCSTPVVSAVGHEVDFTIADFVADVRAPTPSAAALLLVGLFNEHRANLSQFRSDLRKHIRAELNRLAVQMENLHRSLQRYHPRALVEQHRQRLDGFADRMNRELRNRLETNRVAVQGWTHRLLNGTQRRLQEMRHRTQTIAARLEVLHPQATLKRGFAICERTDTREIILSPNQVQPGDPLRIHVRDGKFGAQAVLSDPMQESCCEDQND
ncbi:MAG TPA: exodeoxyribonuclease VII large subunit [bacterium]|nr:exodeoxyribonuclease VII large subunit [bacterium]